MAGLHIGNPRWASAPITVDALVYRLVCKNGLVRLVKGKSLLHHRPPWIQQSRKLRVCLAYAVQEALVQSSGFMERLHRPRARCCPTWKALWPPLRASTGFPRPW
jgi:hypothetical protein